MRAKKWIWLSIRLGVSCLLLTLLFWKIDFSKFSEVLRNTNLSLFLLILFFHILHFIPLAFRWQLLLRVLDIKVPIRKLFETYLIGTFFNRFLPTAIGADLIRGLDLYRLMQKGREITISIVIERFLGFTSLMVIAVAALVFCYPSLQDPILAWLVLGAALIYFAALFVLLTPTFFILVDRILQKFRIHRPGLLLLKIPESITPYKSSPSVIIQSVLLSLFLQIFSILIYYLLSQSLHLTVPLMYMFLFYPVINMFSLIPITLGGLGLREGMTIYLFQKIGVESAHAMGLSLTWYFILILSSALGGIIFVLRNINPSSPSSPHL
jgi:glycosyltransferase 2 family protein